MESSSEQRASCGGRRAALPLALLLSLLVAVLGSPASAQDGSAGENEVVLRADQGSTQGYYVVYGDGSFVMGGDVVGSCDTVLQSTLQSGRSPNREDFRQVEVCEEAGFSVPGSESLPETGGPSLPVVAALGLIVSCALCRLVMRGPGLSGDD